MQIRFRPNLASRLLLALGLWLMALPLVMGAAHAQSPVTAEAVAFGVSEELRNIPPGEDKPTEGPTEVKVNVMKIFRSELPDAPATEDPVAQVTAPETLVPSPSLFFSGLNSDDNAAAFGSRVMPPDTVGDVGPNHYVQMVNNLFRVYDKAGNPLTAKLTLGSLFATISGACANRNDGDPIVLYDPLADRWLLSQFCTVANPFNHQVIAISKTSDPAGAYYLYDFVMPNNKFNDYPKFGVWPDGYYMTDNQFNQAGTAFLGAGAFAFDRAKMLAGDPTAGYIYFDIENGSTNVGGVLPSDIDGLTPPPAGTPNYFAYFTADEFADPAHPFDSLRVYEFRANFANPGASTFTERADSPVLVAPFDPRSPAGRDDIEQPPPATSAANLDGIMDRLMFRLAYRNFGGHESLVVTHTVNASGVTPSTPANLRAGIRYYELRRNLPGGAFTVNEQATFAPADGLERWMGSAAMDGSGNLAVGFSASSLTSFPSIRYAGRLATDPAGGLFQGETVLIAGTGAQTATQSRWGDYSALSVDPADDCTFWFTTQYYTSASAATSSFGWVTGIGRFTFSQCTPVATGTITGTVVNATTNLPIAGATVATTNGFSRLTNASGGYSMSVPADAYTLQASAPGYTTVVASGVTASNGGTVVQNFALQGRPVLAAGTATVGSESCGTGNGAIDPGETVTVQLPIQNTGTAATANLVGTLLASGGITSPGGPQTYGVLNAGGPAVSRPFTFVAAGTCGGSLTATLQLQDGATNLGTVTYTFTLGKLNPFAVNASYSSGNLNVPLPDLTTVDVPLNVPDTGAVSDVNVRIRLNHTFDGDLNISLIGPDGTTVDLSSGNGGGTDNFGTGANNCSGQPTIFDDSSAASITSGTGPFAGTFRPEQALSAFNGKPTAGTWKLRITDTANLDVGTLFCFQLEVSRRVYACCGVAGTPVPQTAGSAVTGESCSPGNGAIDPDEQTTVGFSLVNAGSGDTTSLVATLLPTGGVQQPSGPQTYGVVQAGGPAVSKSFTFVPAGTCGGNVTATLHLQDGPFDLGNVTFNLRLGTTASASYGPFANATSVTIPNSGAGTPYPSNISVSGISGSVSKVTVTLTRMNHTFPGDIDILLVGPGGQKVILMSDTGSSFDLVNTTLTFDDAGPALPTAALINSGTFRPTNSGTGDLFPAPAPAGPSGSALADFAGLSPNGTWSLYVVDDAGGDIGNIAGGWSVNFQTADPVCCNQPCSLACPAPITAGTEPNSCQAAVIFPFPGVTGSCGTLACAPPSNSVFPLGTTTDTCTATQQGGATTMCSFPITIQDVQVPVITGTSVSPASLWPPSHKYEDVTVSYSTADNCSAAAAISCALSVASNEPVNGSGDGDTAPDWVVVDDHHVQLRSERSGGGSGRIYTITITCTDQAGRSASQPVTVTVPHSQ